ncbi:nucleolar MIF4G domain-containing protein 1 [Planococcus citri]|uniref:nucleolar MIF4G domain-containing protein 1 n=1 Tax=Planococcus citri TaxID=170843 RepID=UPI0031F91589
MAKVKRSAPKPSRKQLRKQERLEKKQRKQRRSNQITEEVTPKQQPKPKQKTQQSVKPEMKIAPDPNADKIKFQKLQRSMNMERVKRFKEDNLKEDRVIRSLEKKLKLNVKKKSSLSKSFINEGLDYLLEVCDFEKYKDNINLETELNDIGIKSEFADDLSTIAKTTANNTFEEDFEKDVSDNSREPEDEKIIKKKRKRKKKKADDETETGKTKKLKKDVMSEDEDFPEENVLREDTNSRSKKKRKKKKVDDNVESGAETTKMRKFERNVIPGDEDLHEENSESDEENVPREDTNGQSKKKKKRKKKKVDNKIDSSTKASKINKPEKDALSDDEFEDEDFCDEMYEEDAESDHENVLREDIYGRLRKEDGTVVENQTKYIPPQLRNKAANSSSSSEKLMRLKKQMKGLLNRLTGKNMHSIATQMEQMYGCNSRHDANSTLIELLKESMISDVFSPMRIIIEHALLVSILHANVGTEVGSYVLQQCVEEYHTLMQESVLSIGDKRIDNVIAILVQLYNFKVCHACLIYEILDQLLERFQEKDIDLILLIFNNVGFNLRKDDPAKLKEVIFNVQKKANSSPAHFENSRTKFMLETLLAIKNNNKLKVIQTESDYIESLKKLSKTMLNSGKYVSELKITLDDLLNVESKGRWWIVGSAWQGSTSIGEKTNLKTDSGLTFDEKLLNLARKHRMNTDVRKNIFCILMSAEDFMDAFEKLLKLGLKGNQCQEVIYVTMHCLLQEKLYNPYYSFIAEQFCLADRKYQLAIQYCSWDKFKEMNSLNHQQAANLAQFLAYLMQNKKLAISVLKVLQFTEMNKSMVRFLRQLLLSILLNNEETTIAEVFAPISKSEALFMLREGLQLFLHHFILKEVANKSSDAYNGDLSSLPQKIEVAENAMRGSNSQIDFDR